MTHADDRGRRFTQAILKIQCLNDQGVDKLCWKHNSSGECTSKSAYNYHFKEMNHVQSAIPTLHLNLLKKTWSDKLIPPKVKTFMWRLIRNALPTANNLHFRIPDILDSCHRCNSAKTSVHLFFHCSFARLSWMLSDFKLNFQIIDSMNSVPEIISFILAASSKTESFQKFCIFLWFIWKARNGSYFKRKNWEPSQVCIAADVMASNYNTLTQAQNQDDNSLFFNSPDSNISIPSGTGCFVDASWKDDKSGFGLFLHDPTSHKALFVKASSDTYTSALQAEHASIYVALCICQKLKITDVVFLSDNQVLVKQLRQRNFAAHPQHWSLLPLLQRSE